MEAAAMTVYRQCNFLSRWRNKRSRGVIVPASRQHSSESTTVISRASQRSADGVPGAQDNDNFSSRMPSTSSRDRMRALCQSPTIDESLLEQMFIADVKGMSLSRMTSGDDDIAVDYRGAVTSAAAAGRQRDFGVQTGVDLLETMLIGLRRRHRRQLAVDANVILPSSPAPIADTISAFDVVAGDERRLQLPVGIGYRHSFCSATATSVMGFDGGPLSSFVGRRPSNRSIHVDGINSRSPTVLDVSSAQLLNRQPSYERQPSPTTHLDTVDDDDDDASGAISDSDLDDLLVSVSPGHQPDHRRSLAMSDSPPLPSPSARSPPLPTPPPPLLCSIQTLSGDKSDDYQINDDDHDSVNHRRRPHRTFVKVYENERPDDRLIDMNPIRMQASPRQKRPLVLVLPSPPSAMQRHGGHYVGAVGGQDSFVDAFGDLDPIDDRRNVSMLPSHCNVTTADQHFASTAAAAAAEACRRRLSGSEFTVPDDRPTSSPSVGASSANSINIASSSNTSSEDDDAGEKSMSTVSLEDAICLGMSRLSDQSPTSPLTAELYDFTATGPVPDRSVTIAGDRTNSANSKRAFTACAQIRFQSSDV
jgi:hypothetical protein